MGEKTDSPPDSAVETEIAKLADSFKRMENEEFGLQTTANIVVAGLTGVGKSTLINAMFGADFCATGVGAPVTQGVDRVSHPDKPVVLFDTQGLEIENSEGTLSNLTQLLGEMRRSTNPADHPHAMWLCVNTQAARFEDVHEHLAEIARAHEIPLVIVLTQDFFDDSEELADAIREIVGSGPSIVPVVADTYSLVGRAVKRRGLEVLLNRTAAAMPKAAKTAFEHAQVADLEIRRIQATNIVNRSALLAAGSAFPASFVPIPGTHSVILVALETQMLRSINKALGLHVEHKTSRAMTLGLSGIALASTGGPLVATQIAALIPGIGQISAMTVGASVAAGIVKGLGTAYISAVCELLRAGDLDPTVQQVLDLVKENFGEYTDSILLKDSKR